MQPHKSRIPQVAIPVGHEIRRKQWLEESHDPSFASLRVIGREVNATQYRGRLLRM
jgi:hypothetical protein